MELRIVLVGGLLLGCVPVSAGPRIFLQAGPVESVYAVAFTPDGRLLASGSHDGVRIYDGRTGDLLRAIHTEPCRGIRAMAFSPDGRQLACVGLEMDATVKIWDPHTGALVRTLTGHVATAPGNAYADLYAVAYSPDGKTLATAGMDKLVLVWDLETGKPRHRLTGHDDEVGALAYSPDGKTLAGGGADQVIRLWDPTTGRLRTTLRGHARRINALAFSPDGKTLASGASEYSRFHNRNQGPIPAGEGDVRLWDLKTERAVHQFAAPGRVSSVAFSPDRAKVACGVGRVVRIFDVATGRDDGVLGTHDRAVTSVAFAPDGKSIVSGSHDRSIQCVAFPAGKLEWRAPGCWEQVNAVALSADGSLLATGSSDLRFAEREPKVWDQRLDPGAVRLWDLRTGRLLRRLGDPAEQVMAVAVSPDGRRVAGGVGKADGSGAVRLWDAATGTETWSRADHAAEVLSVAFSPDGTVVASAGAEGTVKLRDAAMGSVTKSLTGHDGGATSVVFSVDGSTLVAGGSDGTAYVWEVRTGRLMRTLRPSDSRAKGVTTDRLLTSVVLSPDGGLVGAGVSSVGNTFSQPAQFWDARTGEASREVGDFRASRPMVLSPDGKLLATGGKTIVLYDVRTGKRLRTLEGPFKKTQAIAFSPDGRRLVSGASNRTTNVWDVATGRHLATFIAFAESRPATDHWVAFTPDSAFDGSPKVDRLFAVQTDQGVQTADRLDLRRPDLVKAALGSR
jgi:WD40 repeat protein